MHGIKKLLKRIRVRTWIALCLMAIFLPIVLFTLYKPNTTQATWFDDAYGYRQKISFTHNAALTNRRVEITIDTESLIAAGKMQDDCDDTRFTDINGKLLAFELTGSCDDSATTYDVVFPTVVSGTNIGYVYYGNPGAENVSQDVSAYTSLSPNGGAASLASEEKGVGPIAYWAFDEGYGSTARDSSSNSNSGSISESAWQPNEFCISGKCLYFDGSDDVVTVSPTAPINFSQGLSSGFTVIAWIRPNGAGEGDGGQIFRKGTSESDTWLRVDTLASGYLDIQAQVDQATDATLNVVAAVKDNEWTQVALTYTDDGDDELTIWVNGKAVGTSTNGVGPIDSDTTRELFIGGDSSNNFKGFIDEFKIYNYEKTVAQIQADYTARGGNEGVSVSFGAGNQKFLSDGLVGYWKMDESSGNADDSSGNDLTLTNNATTTYTKGKFANGSEYVPASSQYFSTASTISGVKSISFWANPDSTSNYYASLTSSAYITSSSGTLSATGFTSPTIYVNGVQSSTIVADTWQLITITTETAIDANQFYIGRQGSNYYDGTMDEFRVYTRALSSAEVQALYNWAPGPVGYWKLDEKTGTTANDSSTNSNTGTFSGNTTWVKGVYGSAASFDGNDDEIDASSGASLDDMPGSAGMSISAWIYAESLSGSFSYRDIISKAGNNNPGTGWAFVVRNTGALQFAADFDGASNLDHRGTSGAVTTNTWYHVAATWDGSSTAANVKLYVNGINVSGGSTTNGAGNRVSEAAQTLYIGGIGTGGNVGESFDGYIDDVRVYNYIRTQSQIVEDMNGGHPIGGSPIASQVIHYRMDEQSGSTLHNGNPLLSGLSSTISGASWRTSADCISNGCLEFDGSDDVATTTNTNAIDLNGNLSSSFTFSTWIYADSDGENDTGQIFQKGSATYCRTDSQSSSNLDLECSLDLATTDATLNISSAITTGTWNHIVIGYTDDADDEITVWVNGKNRGSSTNGVGAPAAESSNLLIGGSTSANFDGKIDEFKVYATELTAEQVAIDYNAGSAINFGSTGVTEASQIIDGAGAPPVAYYNFDEKSGAAANDRSGNGNTGTVNGTTTSFWTQGKYGSAGSYNGTDNYTSFTHTNELPIYNNTAFSVSMWVKNNDLTLTDRQFFFMGSTTDNDTYYGLGTGSTAGGANQELQLFIRNDSGTSLLTTTTTDATGFVGNDWHHFVLIDNNGVVSLYRNGVPITWETSSTYTRGTLTINSTAVGAAVQGSVSNYFNGVIDEVKLYDYALTQAQVAYEYNRGLPISWWRMDECQGTTLRDSSPNNNHATLTIGSSGSNTSAGNCTSGSSSEAWANGASGRFNGSVDFDNTDDYADSGDDDNLSDFADGRDFSISAWFYRDGSTNQDTLVSKSSNCQSTPAGYCLYAGSSGELNFAVSDGTDRYHLESSTLITGTGWHHVVAVFDDDSASNTKLYIDGKDDNATPTGTLANVGDLTNSVNLIIGAQTSSTHHFNGKLDDVRLYSYALSAAQVKQVYNDNSGARFGPASGQP